MTLTPIQAAQARQRAYELLARLFLYGVQAEDRPVLDQIPELAPLIADPFDPDEAAANHQALFGFNLLPYESLFLSKAGVLGGPTTDLLLQHAAEIGFQVASDSAIDHVGQQLLVLAQLAAVEWQMLERGELHEAARQAQAQAAWLEAHLLRWLGPLQCSLLRQDDPFYSELGAVTLALLADYWQTHQQREPTGWSLPVPANILEDERSGLKEIAAFLMAPSQSGLFLTKNDLARLGRPFRLPRGFGSREQMMANLLRSAAQYDEIPQLMAALQMLIEGSLRQYDNWSGQWLLLEPFFQPWQHLLAHSSGVAGEISLKAASLS